MAVCNFHKAHHSSVRIYYSSCTNPVDKMDRDERETDRHTVITIS